MRLLGLLAAVVSVAFTESLIWLRGRFKQLTSVPKWVKPAIGGLATGVLAVLGLQLFHHNGIAGDPYATLTWALTGTMPLALMGSFWRAEARRDGLFLRERRLGRHLCPGAVHGSYAGGSVGWLDVTVYSPPLVGLDRSLRRRRHGCGLCGRHPRANDIRADRL